MKKKKLLSCQIDIELSSHIGYNLLSDKSKAKLTKFISMEKVLICHKLYPQVQLNIYLNGEDKLWGEVDEISLIGKATLHECLKEIFNEKASLILNSDIDPFKEDKREVKKRNINRKIKAIN